MIIDPKGTTMWSASLSASQRLAHDELAGLLAQVAQGQGACAVLQGPEGSGKSTVLRHFCATVQGAGCEAPAPAIISAASTETDEPGAALAPLTASEPGADARQLADDLLRHLQPEGAQPQVLVIENTQWVDPQSLAAIRQACRRLRGRKVLILLELRDGQLGSLPAAAREFLDEAHLRHVHLPVPSAGAVRELVLSRLGRQLTAGGADALCRYTLGNLRLVFELLREYPQWSWEQWNHWPPAPRSLSADVQRILQVLSPRTRRLLQAAAVLGPAASLDVVVTLVREPKPFELVQQLADSRLAAVSGHSGRGQVDFRDAPTRMAVYHQIPLVERIELHERAAQLVEGRGEALAHRADASLLPDGQLAGELAEYAASQGHGGQWAAAAEGYHRAMQLVPDAQRRNALLLKAVDAFVAAGELPRALSFAHRLSTLPGSAERDVLSGYIAILQGRAQTARRWLDSAWDNAVHAHDAQAMAVVSQRRVLDSLGWLKGQQLLDWAEQSLQLAAPGGPLAIESAAIQGLGLAMMGRGEQGEQALLKLLATLPTGAQRQRAEMALGWVYLATDRIELARHALSVSSSTDFSDGSHRIALWARAWRARAEFLMGDWDHALETVRDAQALQEQSGIQLLRPLIHLTAVQVHAMRGAWNLVEAHLARAWSQTGSYPVMEVPYRIARAEAAQARANHEEVLMALSPLLEMDRSQGIDEPGFWPWQHMYAAALIRSEKLAEAEAFLAPLLERALTARHASASARYLSLHGMLLAARGDIDAARDAFEQALASLQGIGAPFYRAGVDLAYGQVLRRAGKRAECVAPLTRAMTTFTHLKATVYVEWCTRELQASGYRMERRQPADWSTLTPQEQAVAKLVCEGASNKRVAEELFIGTKTVQYHLTKIYAKLSVSSRTELAALARGEVSG